MPALVRYNRINFVSSGTSDKKYRWTVLARHFNMHPSLQKKAHKAAITGGAHKVCGHMCANHVPTQLSVALF